MGPDVGAPLADLTERLARIEERIAALEANLARAADEQPDRAELGRLEWFMRHGRRRPW